MTTRAHVQHEWQRDMVGIAVMRDAGGRREVLQWDSVVVGTREADDVYRQEDEQDRLHDGGGEGLMGGEGLSAEYDATAQSSSSSGSRPSGSCSPSAWRASLSAPRNRSISSSFESPYCYTHDDAIVIYSIPANKNLGPYLFGGQVEVRELARLWAPDGHRENLLTEALAASLRSLRADTGVQAVVSFADPNHGHHGGIYQAASWIYTGKSSETRVYLTPDGRTLSRRSFHSGSTSLIPDITPVRLEGKHRYVRCLTRTSRRFLRRESLPYPKTQEIAA